MMNIEFEDSPMNISSVFCGTYENKGKYYNFSINTTYIVDLDVIGDQSIIWVDDTSDLNDLTSIEQDIMKEFNDLQEL